MAFASVGPLAAVLGRMGVGCILQPEEVPAPYSLCTMPGAAERREARPDQSGKFQAGRPRHGMSEGGQRQPPRQARQGAPAKPAWQPGPAEPASPGLRQRPAFQPQKPAPQPQPVQRGPQTAPRPAAWRTAGGETARRSASKAVPFTRLAPEAWPKPWQDLRARMKRAWLCWTYWELGEDLCGTPDPARRQTLGQLISALHRPAGTNTFWPPVLPGGADSGQGAPVSSRDLFWSGVKELGARMVVAMGYRASIAIGLSPEDVRPLHWEMHNGVIVCTAWDFFRIAEQPSRLGDIVTYLNATFRQLRL